MNTPIKYSVGYMPTDLTDAETCRDYWSFLRKAYENRLIHARTDAEYNELFPRRMQAVEELRRIGGIALVMRMREMDSDTPEHKKRGTANV